MSKAPTVGVVIVSYNTRQLLTNCLRSLAECPLPLRVVVVDNDSSDGSVAHVRRDFPTVELVALTTNSGFAAGTNTGLRTLGYGTPAGEPPPFALLLNPDTIVRAGAIEVLVQFLQDHPRVGLVGPRLLNPDGSRQIAAFRFPTLAMSLLDVFPPGEALPGRLYNSWWHGRYPQEQADTAAPFAIDHPLGACMLTRRDVLAVVGLLDERYFMYSEEIEWCWRIRQNGWAIWQQPAAQVVHVGGAATSQFRWRMFVALHRSRVTLFEQHYTARFLRLHRIVIWAGMLRLTMLAWCGYAAQRMPRDELRTRLLAYGAVARL